jgi:hypothetical protein
MGTKSLESLRYYRSHAWNPAEGPDAARQQLPPRPPAIRADGWTERLDEGGALWAPSQGPSRPETGGAGGEPNGRTVAIRKDCWD